MDRLSKPEEWVFIFCLILPITSLVLIIITDVETFSSNSARRRKHRNRTTGTYSDVHSPYIDTELPQVLEQPRCVDNDHCLYAFFVPSEFQSRCEMLKLILFLLYLGICQHHCVILYVYIGDMTDAGGVLTFYIPAIIDDEG